MNGQTIRTRQSPGILVALLTSSLLHGAVVMLPYLGASSRESPETANPAPAKASRLTAVLATPAKAPLNLPAPEEPPLEPEAAAPEESPTDEPPNREHREGADVLPIDAPLFYPAEQLTERPKPVKARKLNAEIDTPETQAIIASGKIILKLWINDLGEVVEVEIEKSDLPEIFGKSAANAFMNTRFSPGMRQGKHVGSVMRIEVTYADGRRPPEIPAAPPPSPPPGNLQP